MCGIVGIVGVRKAAELAVVGLHTIQNRGADSAGVTSSDGTHLYHQSGHGLARVVFDSSVALDRLHGLSAIGHVRYATVDAMDSDRDTTQPVLGWYDRQRFAVAHNGNLTNVDELRAKYPHIKLATWLDSEWIVRLLEHFDTGNIIKDLQRVLSEIKGSYSLGILFPKDVIIVRDPAGNRPLTVGELEGGYVFASESCVLSSMDARKLFDLEPGHLVVLSENHEPVIIPYAAAPAQHCAFEHVYFASPASNMFGVTVTDFRLRLGQLLEEVAPATADIVVPVPDSANFMAQGYGSSGRSGVYMPAITRNHYVGRTFTAGTHALRNSEGARKFIYAKELIEGKRVVLVDDSIVRGNTLPRIIEKLRRLGALEVHVRIGSPPILHPCFYGINIKSSDELIAATLSVPEVCQRFDADSLEYLPLEDLKSLYRNPGDYCYACMNGKYWH